MTAQLQSSTLVLTQYNAQQIPTTAAAGQESLIARYKVDAGTRWDFNANNPMHYIWMNLVNTDSTPTAIDPNSRVVIVAARSNGDGRVTLFDGIYEQVSQGIADQRTRALFQEGITLSADRIVTVIITSAKAVNTQNMKIQITGRMWN